MAGRFVFQKFSSQISRSRSLVGVHAFPAATADAPATRPTLAARYFNTFPCFRASAKTSCTTTGMPSIITNRMKPAVVGSVRGAKRTFSSNANNDKFFRQQIQLSAFTSVCVAVGVLCEECSSTYGSQSGSRRCSSCCNGQCGVSKS